MLILAWPLGCRGEKVVVLCGTLRGIAHAAGERTSVFAVSRDLSREFRNLSVNKEHTKLRRRLPTFVIIVVGLSAIHGCCI